MWLACFICSPYPHQKPSPAPFPSCPTNTTAAKDVPGSMPFLLPTHLPPAVHSQCCWCPPGPHSPSTTALAAAQCCLPHAQPPRSPWQAEQLQHCSSSVCNAKGNTTLRGTSVPGQKERKRGCIFRVKNAGFKQRGKISMFPVTEEAGRRQSPPHLAFLIPGN